MAYYAVGDIQGCYEPLVKLLDQVNFDPSKDKLLCVGDLVNRGPKSLKTLKYLMSLGSSCEVVLGNHDIHLLSMIYGIRKPRPNDTLNKVLDSSHVSEIADWLRNRPLLRVNKKRSYILCHAGIYPWWTLDKAQEMAAEVERVFSDEKKCVKLLSKIYSNYPPRWSDGLGKVQRRRFTINAFTRMRFCSPKGNLNLTESGYNGKSRRNRMPWFHYQNPTLQPYRIIFGHWSALGLMNTHQHLALDTGCVWGREMTLAKLPKRRGDAVQLYRQKA